MARNGKEKSFAYEALKYDAMITFKFQGLNCADYEQMAWPGKSPKCQLSVSYCAMRFVCVEIKGQLLSNNAGGILTPSWLYETRRESRQKEESVVVVVILYQRFII